MSVLYYAEIILTTIYNGSILNTLAMNANIFFATNPWEFVTKAVYSRWSLFHFNAHLLIDIEW